MKKLLVATLSVAAFTVGAAQAADLPVKAPVAPVIAPASWAGIYIGGNAGGAWSRDSYSFVNGAGTVESFNFNPSSFIGGGQVGVQGQWGRAVLGLEGTYSWTSLNQTQVSPSLAPNTRSMKIDEIATVTAKGGYAWDNMLLYAKLGWAGARMNDSSLNPLGITSSAQKWGNGVTVGAGLDYRLMNNIIVGVEADYYKINYDSVTTGTNPPGFMVAYNSGSASIFSVVGRVSYLFNAWR